MKLTQLFTDDEAVSPVIRVILMVAITVVLAAVIGTFVLSLGNQVQSTTPHANFAVDYDRDRIASGNDTLSVTHDGGAVVDAPQLSVRSDTPFKANGTDATASNASKTFPQMGATGRVTAGTSVQAMGNDFAQATFRVVWTSESGDSSATLRTWSGPDA